MSEVPAPDPSSDESSSPAPSPPAEPWRTWFPYVHAGALGYLGWIALGLVLDLLALPPGPFPPAIFLADAPFLCLLWHAGGVRWKRWAFLYGVLHFAVATRWVMEIDPTFVLGTGFVLGPIYVLLGFAIRWVAKRGGPYILTVGLCVVLEEMLRTVWMGGMPWPARSLSFAGDFAPLLVPATAYVGAYGLSFLAGCSSAVASGIPSALRAPPAERRLLWRRVGFATLLPTAVFAALAGLAMLRHSELEDRRRQRKAYEVGKFVSVQANVPQSLKHGEASERDEMFRRHLDLTSTAIEHVGEGRVFCLMWPETMVPWVFVSPELAARFPEQWSNQVRVMRRIKYAVPPKDRVTLLIGAIHHFRRGDERHVDTWSYGSHDSLFHVVPSYIPEAESPFDEYPRVQWENPNWFAPWERGRHDKINLVPGGEYTPLGDVLPFLRWFRNVVSVIPELDPGATPGEADQQPFQILDQDVFSRSRNRGIVRKVHAGTVVCFDLAFPETCREWRAAGAQVLLNTANYGWFGETGFRAQIRAVARLRAAELGMTVVMAGNTGPTCFFGPTGTMHGDFHAVDDGRVRDRVPAGGDETTFRQGFAVGKLSIDEVATVYARRGPWPWILAGALVLIWTLRTARARKRA